MIEIHQLRTWKVYIIYINTIFGINHIYLYLIPFRSCDKDFVTNDKYEFLNMQIVTLRTGENNNTNHTDTKTNTNETNMKTNTNYSNV